MILRSPPVNEPELDDQLTQRLYYCVYSIIFDIETIIILVHVNFNNILGDTQIFKTIQINHKII